MADTVIVNPSTGVSEATTVAFDDCGAAGKAQIIKLAVSADGSATVLPADAANGLDVDVTRSALPTGASTEATLAAVLALLGSASATAITDTGTVAATKYMGVTVAETSGMATAKVRVRNNNVSGTILDTITLNASESVSYSYPRGRTIAAGTLYMQVVSGAVEGSVFTA